jgi:hypothetical protein
MYDLEIKIMDIAGGAVSVMKTARHSVQYGKHRIDFAIVRRDGRRGRSPSSPDALANAVWHAIGVRPRRFPIRIEDMLNPAGFSNAVRERRPERRPFRTSRGEHAHAPSPEGATRQRA